MSFLLGCRERTDVVERVLPGLVSDRLQIAAWTELLDLVGKDLEELRDLVETVAVAAGELGDAVLPPGAVVVVPVLRRRIPVAEEGSGEVVDLLRVGHAEVGESGIDIVELSVAAEHSGIELTDRALGIGQL